MERFHTKTTTIEESKDIEKIPLIELVRDLQTYELGLAKIGKGRKSKSQDNEDEDFLMMNRLSSRHTSQGISKNSLRMPM